MLELTQTDYQNVWWVRKCYFIAVLQELISIFRLTLLLSRVAQVVQILESKFQPQASFIIFGAYRGAGQRTI